MGTRHLICVFNRGEYRVAQYGQWDGYPEGQGLNILGFLRNGENVEKLRERSLQCSFITEKEKEELLREYGIDKSEYDPVQVGRFLADCPQFNRDTSAELLRFIAETKVPVKLDNFYDFSADSLFCEWAYVIDFDKNTFEVYEGFVEAPIAKTERFYADEESLKEGGSKYYPVKFVTCFDLADLPKEDAFVSACKKNGNEDAGVKE